MPAEPTLPLTRTAPVFGTAALAILGSMVLLIAALTVVLIQTTWATAAASVEIPAPADHPSTKSLAHR